MLTALPHLFARRDAAAPTCRPRHSLDKHGAVRSMTISKVTAWRFF